jgi:hypothetical protein
MERSRMWTLLFMIAMGGRKAQLWNEHFVVTIFIYENMVRDRGVFVACLKKRK